MKLFDEIFNEVYLEECNNLKYNKINKEMYLVKFTDSNLSDEAKNKNLHYSYIINTLFKDSKNIILYLKDYNHSVFKNDDYILKLAKLAKNTNIIIYLPESIYANTNIYNHLNGLYNISIKHINSSNNIEISGFNLRDENNKDFNMIMIDDDSYLMEYSHENKTYITCNYNNSSIVTNFKSLL